MTFKRMTGNQGLLYVPDETTEAKKHGCPDCHFCQWCSDERCGLCRNDQAKCASGRRCRRSPRQRSRAGA